jgi:hypothetical protein
VAWISGERSGSVADAAALFNVMTLAAMPASRDNVRQTTAAMGLTASLRRNPASHRKRSSFDV